MQVDTQAAFERTWRDVQGYLRAVLERAGVDALQAEELTVLPGAEEVLALLEVRAQVTSRAVGPRRRRLRADRRDAAAAGAAGGAAWYVERVFPAQRRALRAVRPLLSRVAGPAVPRDDVFDAVERLHRELPRCGRC